MQIRYIYSTIYIKYLSKLKRVLFEVDVSIIYVGEHQVIRVSSPLKSTSLIQRTSQEQIECTICHVSET